MRLIPVIRDRTVSRPTSERAAPARGLRPHRPGHRPGRRARPGELLHLVPRARQGLVLEGPEGEGAGRRLPQDGVRRAARRLPARGEDLRVPHGEGARRAARRARHHRGRQPDGRGHRPPHLQRLHEVLHLPEAGPGRHPASRDPHAEGRARAAVGIRDLFAAHALEPVRPAPAAIPSPPPANGCWWSASDPRASPSRTT